MDWHRRIQIGLVLILLGVVCSAAVRSRQAPESNPEPLQFVRGSQNIQTRNDADILDGLLDKIENSWEVGKNHERVRSTFEEIVNHARQATVRISNNKKQLCLGTIVDPNGLIVTKASEIEGRQSLICRFFSGKQRAAVVVGVIDRHDVALLRVRAKRLPFVQFEPKQKVAVGSIVATTGLGTKPIAIGVISDTRRQVKSDAILGIKIRERKTKPVITEVIPNSAAQRAGLLAEDIILRINDQHVKTERHAVEMISQHLPGEKLHIEVQRGPSRFAFEAKLGRYAELDTENGDFQGYLGGDLSHRRSGFPMVIQHDTFLLPKHCGGPIVDLKGNVVGVNIARAERIASYALPCEILVQSIEKIRKSQSADQVAAAD